MTACDGTFIGAEESAPLRNSYLDLLKIISMIFVVYIHSSNIIDYAGLESVPRMLIPIRTFVATAVPSFFILSAYLLFSKPFAWKKNIVKKIKSLLAPYLFWSIFYVLFEVVGHMVFPAAFDGVGSWGCAEWFKAVFGIPFYSAPIYAPLWFLRNLFILNLIAPVFLLLLKVAPILILAVGGVIWFGPFSSEIRESITFFLLGGYIALHKRSISKKTTIVVLLLLTAAVALLQLLVPEASTDYAHRVIILFDLYVVFSVSRVLVKRRSVNKTIEWLSRYTFPVYVMHGKQLTIFQNIAVRVVPQTAAIVVAEYALLPVFCISVAIFEARLFFKLMPRLYSVVMGKR